MQHDRTEGDVATGYGGLDESINSSSRECMKPPKLTWWARLDQRYMQPIFVANPSITGGSTKQKFMDLGRILTTLCYQPDSHDKKHAILLDILNKFQQLEEAEMEEGKCYAPITPSKEKRTPSRVIPETRYDSETKDSAGNQSVASTPEKIHDGDDEPASYQSYRDPPSTSGLKSNLSGSASDPLLTPSS